MEKLDLQIFRELRQEIINYINKYREAEERGEYLSDEEQQQFLARYKEIIEILSEHDLSDIDFEEWRGMLLFADDENPLDFSKTKANIDFSIIEYDVYKAFPNFKSCQIKHFDFEKNDYTPEMFDEEFRKENEGKFLSENLPEEVSDRFYKGELTLADIQNNPELANKIEEKNLAYGLRDIYKIIGREEFCKLDAQFIDTTRYSWTELLNSNPNLRTAEKIMPVLYRSARDQIIGYSNDDINRRFYHKQDQLGYRFREENPDLFLSEESPESLREHYYEHRLSIKEFSENLKYFEGKAITHSFRDYDSDGMKIVNLYGDDIYQLFVNYKPIIDRLLNDHTAMQTIEVPTGPITEEQRKEIMSTALTTYITRNGLEQVQNWDEFKMILDFIPMEYLPATPTTRKFIKKYGIDKIIESGLDIKYLFKDQKLTSIEEIASLNGIELKDIKKLVDRDSKRLLDSYDVKQLLEYGIKDLSELSETYNDLHQVKEMLEKRPLDLINMGRFQDIKKEFIEKYGIDNIIALDEETNGMFSHQLWRNDIYLTMLAEAERRAPKLEGNEQLTYEQFRDRMYEILLHARDERGVLTGRDYEDYDFIQGAFRRKHQDIFLDGEFPEDVKKAFYTRHMTAEMVRQNTDLIQLLQGKDLSRAFDEEYSELFKRFDNKSIMKLGTRNPEIIEKMVQNHKEDVLQNWYRSTGGKFVPHHVVMLNFPEGEIDSFLGNSKRWSQLMRIDNYNLNDDGKAAILKASYAMGVFQGDDDGFNKTMKLFTDVPQELTQEEYEKVTSMFSGAFDPFRFSGSNFDPEQKDKEMKSLFEQAYTLNDEGKYVFSMDKQKNKDSVRMIREILEKAQIPRILTPEKAHQMFDSFAMEYNPDFVRFFNDNIEEILSNPEYTKDIATMQRQFKDIVRTNAGRRLTLDVAQNYIKSILYTDIEVGNEGVAEQAKIAGYSQKDFEAIQSLFNEGEVRDFSSIPRIQGSTKGYTYEMLRCDDPLALTIGTLTDCCQEIHGAGQTSMEHSVVSPDGRVFCVKDAEGRLVAQSWFWRNQYTGCFDNIEIPHRIFELYEKEHPDLGKKGLTIDVLEVYKKAAQDLMQEDSRVYQELLDNGTISQEQYDALLLGKVTIGLGYNDIADAIKVDKTIHQETDRVGVKGTDRLPHPYTDASTQYTIAERRGIIKSEHENLYVHQDDVPVFDGTNMSSMVLLTMKRMEQATERDNLAYLSERNYDDEEKLPKSQKIINSIAREYQLDPNDTRVMATARIALIYSKDKDNKVKIGDLLSSPLRKGLTEEQKQKATAHIMHQVKKALKQIGVQGSEVDLSSLSEEQQQMLQSVMQEIEKENDERGER